MELISTVKFFCTLQLIPANELILPTSILNKPKALVVTECVSENEVPGMVNFTEIAWFAMGVPSGLRATPW